MLPKEIGPYRIEHKLGSGGMGDVYLAFDSRLDRQVAIKALRTDTTIGTPSAHQTLLSEARAAAALSHQAIAAVFDVIESADQLLLVMEYVPGRTLAALIEGGLGSDDVLNLAVQIADGVAYAHSQGVQHCDLKPANIMVTPAGRAKVLDFGLAHHLSAGKTQALAGDAGEKQVRGTLHYMAPEVLAGHRSDARSDVYSLGVTIYEMCCGTVPYKEPDVLGLIDAILTRAPVPLSRLAPVTGPTLEPIVARAMAREPTERYQTASELREALELVRRRLQLTVTRSHPGIPPPVSSSRRARRRPVVAGAMGLTLAASVVTLLLGVSATSGTSTPRAGADPVLAIVAASPIQAAGAQGLTSGFSDVLATELARLSDVVVARTTETDKPAATDQREAVAQRAGASHLVVPSVTETPDTVDLRVDLESVGPRRLLWTERVSGAKSDVLKLQRRLSAALILALQRRGLAHEPVGAQAGRARQSMTADVDAFAEYSQGRSFETRPDLPGNLDRALSLFERAASRDPDFSQAHAALGRIALAKYRQSKDAAWVERARREMLEALRLSPESSMTRYSLAALYAETGKAETARLELEQVLERDPENDDAHRLLGRLMVEAGAFDNGLMHLETARTLRPEYWDNYRALGLAYFNQGRFVEAIHAFSRLTELQPDSVWGYQTLGTAYHASGDRVHALANYRKALAIAPSARTYANIGTLLYEDRRFDEAIKAYDQALTLRPNDPMTHRNRGDALLRSESKALADAAYRRCVSLTGDAVQVDPRNADMLALQGYCAARLGHSGAAVSVVTRAAQLSPADNQVIFEQAVVLVLAERPCEALRSLREALRLGYSTSLAARDDDLKELAGQPEFDRLVGATGAKGRWAASVCESAAHEGSR